MQNVPFVKVQKLLQNCKRLMKQYAVGCFKVNFHLSLKQKLRMMAHMEAWQSGLMHGLENRRGLIPLREFESHRFRQILKALCSYRGFFSYFSHKLIHITDKKIAV